MYSLRFLCNVLFKCMCGNIKKGKAFQTIFHCLYLHALRNEMTRANEKKEPREERRNDDAFRVRIQIIE